MVAATGSGTAASRSGTKKDGSEGGGNKGPQGRASSGPSSSGGGARSSGAGGAGGVRGGNSTGSAQHESAGSQARSGGGSPASSARSGPGGAGGVRNTPTGTRQAQTSARVGSSTPRGSILGNPSVVSRAADPGVAGVPGGLLGRNQATRTGMLSPANATALAQLNRIDRAQVNALSRSGRIAGPTGIFDESRINNTLGQMGLTPGQYSIDPAQAAMQRLMERGFSFDAARAIVGRQMVESGMNPLIGGDLRHGLPTALGISQWRDGRLAGLQSEFGPFSGVTKKGALSGPGLLDQADYAAEELRGTASNYDPQAAAVGGRMLSNPGTVGNMARDFTSNFERPGFDKAGNRLGIKDAIANARGLGFDSTPTLADAVRAPKMQDRISPDMDMSGYRSPMASVGSLPPLSDAVRNMNMAGYQSPMAQVGNIPAAPGRMDMGGYQSPMAGVGNLPSEPGSMNMAGYNSPMADVSGVPGQEKIQDRLSAGYSGPAHFNPPGAPMTKGPVLTSDFNGIKDQSRISDPLSAGMSFNPGLPGQMAPNMDMAGYQSPMVGTSGMPRAPSGNIAGMSFNPGLPGMMSGPSRSRSPMVNGEPQMASNFPARPEYLGSYPAAPTQTAQGIPNQPGLEAQNKSGGLLAGLGKAIKTAAAAPVQKVEDLVSTVKNNIANPGLRFLEPPGPGNPLFEGGQQHAYRGGDVPAQWTGKESPTVVAQMQQHVEDVLRSYFTGELVNPVA